MSLQEEIFVEFVKKLEAAKLPAKIITGLRRLWENNELESKENIMNVLKEAVENVTHQNS
jgi:hypothetical protein